MIKCCPKCGSDDIGLIEFRGDHDHSVHNAHTAHHVALHGFHANPYTAAAVGIGVWVFSKLTKLLDKKFYCKSCKHEF